jgi:endonuclease/exonuclease/phosphatase family metal-dependent hydrolase
MTISWRCFFPALMMLQLVLIALLQGTPRQEIGPQALAQRSGDLTIATWNLEWFFDWYLDDNQSELAKVNSAPSKKDWEWRLDVTADAIAKLRPSLLALQEIENRKVMEELSRRIQDRHQLKYDVCFIQGRDSSTEQDVAILCQSGLRPQVRRAPEPRDFDRRQEKSVTKQLMVELPWGQEPHLRHLTIITVHLMAGEEVGKEMDRCDQARYIKRWVREEHRRNHYVVLLGDMNTVPMRPNRDLKDSAIDVLTGKDTPNDPDDDLVDVVQSLGPEDRVTFAGKHSTLDHILISPKLRQGPGIAFENISNRRDVAIRGKMPDSLWRGDRRFWKIPSEERDVSDHYPLMAHFRMKN